MLFAYRSNWSSLFYIIQLFPTSESLISIAKLNFLASDSCNFTLLGKTILCFRPCHLFQLLCSKIAFLRNCTLFMVSYSSAYSYSDASL
jgi:hypothetical protein